MNYRHSFHAGNFADVHKHITLLALLDSLLKKPKPLFFLDTHAGRGEYDLTAREAQRGGEWQAGIGRLFDAEIAHPIVHRYVQLVRQRQGSPSLRRYPGSPLLAAQVLREIDRRALIEKHAEEARALRTTLRGQPNSSVAEDDAYHALRAYLPPKENRGLVLLDPPYEQPNEFSRLHEGLMFAVQRWPNGVYCAWYPLKAGDESHALHAGLVRAGLRKLLISEIWLRPVDAPVGLNGSGLILVNPPWQLDLSLRAAMQEILPMLASSPGAGMRVEWLVGESAERPGSPQAGR